MERWESLVENYPLEPDIRAFNKMRQTAAVILKEDLAEFEIKRYLKTLFLKPISLIATIEKRRNETAWLKSISDVFKLIGEIVVKYGEENWLEDYYQDLSNLCILRYDATTEASALNCLTSIVRTHHGAAHHQLIVDRLKVSCAPGGTCKAPLAVLVGAICENYPTLVQQSSLTIFRTYLTMLDSNKNSDTVTNAILKGLNGVFKHLDLPTSDLMSFYIKMSSLKLIESYRHEDAILSLLQHHAALFKEKLSEDLRVRQYLWSILKDASGSRGEKISAALLSVYRALCDVLQKTQLKCALITEVLPKVKMQRLVKYTALRIMTHVQTDRQIALHVDSNVDMQKLEFMLRNENASYECADAINWCISSKLPNSNRLLQTAVLFYANIPILKRKDVVINVLNADSELRQQIITSLITETCLNETNMEAYLPFWEMLFDTRQAKTLGKHSELFSDYVMHLSHSVQLFLDEYRDDQQIPKKLENLLHLTSYVLSCQNPCQYTERCCVPIAECCLQLLRDCGATVALVEILTELMRHNGEGLPVEAYQYINIDRCRDEALMCACCLTLIQAPQERVRSADLLVALEIIFSRNDVEPKMLIKTLQQLDNYINNNHDNVDNKHLFKVINLVEKLRSRKDLVGKDARVLQRNVIMFLGKHSVSQTIDPNNNNVDNSQMVQLRLQKLLILDIPNTTEGATVYKLNLDTVLREAISKEDPVMLNSLMTIMCANLSTKEPSLQMALCRVLHALCRAHSRGCQVDARALLAAALMCATPQCARLLTNYISVEKSPGVRRMLSDALESLLMETPSSEHTVSLIETVAEDAFEMMESGDSTKRRAGLDVIQSLVIALESSHSSLEKLLPRILVSIPKTGELDSIIAFEVTSKLFVQHSFIFENTVLDNLAKNIFEIILLHTDTQKDELKIYKNIVKMCLELLEHIFQNKDVAVFDFLKNLHFTNEGRSIFDLAKNDDEVFKRLIYVMAMMNSVFADDFDDGIKDSELLDRFFKIESFENNFDFETILVFVKEYNCLLLDVKYQETHECIASLIKRLKPANVLYIQKILQTVLPLFNRNAWPAILIDSYQNWLSSLPLDDITDNLNRLDIDKENVPILKSIRVMSGIFKIKMTAIDHWSLVIYNGFKDEPVHVGELSNLTDALTAVAMTAADVKRVMTDGSAGDVCEFVRGFMGVFFEGLVSEPFLLLDEELEDFSPLIKDVVRWCNKKRYGETYGARILGLVDLIWPAYVSKSNFHQRCELLQDLLLFPEKLDTASRPIQWVLGVLDSDQTSLPDKAALVGVLPGGGDFSATYRRYASLLPSRLSDMRSPFDSMFRALLDALAANGDMTLLDIVISLAKGDDTTGWWDDAIDSCVASLATRRALAIHEAVYKRCSEGTTTGVCRRLMVPLLRYSPSLICERFFSKIIKDVLDIKKRRQMAPADNDKYLEYVMNCVRELTVLQLAFEKISSISLESPSSILYSEVSNEQSWFMVRSVCKLCVTLRDKIKCPESFYEEIVDACRALQCAAFNCLSAALCCRRPAPRTYDFVFNHTVWSNLVNASARYELPLKTSWNPRTKRHAVPISVGDSSASSSSTLTMTRTVRTRLFVDQLSEDPLHYDMLGSQDEDAEVVTQDLNLTHNELNMHEVSATLTALFCHASSLEDDKWLKTLVSALEGDMERNPKWLLTQAVCNAKEELKRHASALRPALLAVIESTAEGDEEEKTLNGLHVEILDTLCYWGESEVLVNASTAVQYLIQTCLVNMKNEYVYKSLLDTLTKFLSTYKQYIHLEWDVFENYVDDPETMKQPLQILLKVAKNRVNVRGLLQNVLRKFTNKYSALFSNMAELFGLAMAACDGGETKNECLVEYLRILDKHRSDNGYINLLYYAQLNCKECCDSRNFRLLPSMIFQLPTAYKIKCLKVISTYLSTLDSADDETVDLFASLDICQMVANEDTVLEAIGVVKNGFQTMDKRLRTRCVTIIAGHCQHSLVKVRRAAMEMVLEVFKDMFRQPSEHQPKRQKQDSTPLLRSLDNLDLYTKTILSAVGLGCIDDEVDIARAARAGVAGCLSSVDMGVRFVEAFLVTILSPMRSTDSRKRDMSACTSAFLDVLFRDLMEQESFKSIKLRDEPLVTVESGNSKLLTMSKSYQGTMRSTKVLVKKDRRGPNTDWNQSGIDVQVTVASILDSILNFTKINPETSQAICVDMMRILIEMKDRGFEFNTWMSKVLVKGLTGDVCSVTPLIVEASRLLIDDVSKEDGIEGVVEKLRRATLHTEGEELSEVLHEDLTLRVRGSALFEIGTECQKIDSAMEEEKSFSLEDLVACFGKLANWDQLTMQQRDSIKSSGLPLLWTDNGSFERSLNCFKDSEEWFGKMRSAHLGDIKQDTVRLLTSVDKWPRRSFVTSAITETINWEETTDIEGRSEYTCVIRDSDCLVEWSARLMLRFAHTMRTHEDDDHTMMLSRSHELKWCASANERELSPLVLQCVKRNGGSLDVDETLAWLEQRVVALRNIGLERNDTGKLLKALDIADEFTPKYAEHSSRDVVISMYKLILVLNCDLKSLTTDKLEDILKHIDKQTDKKTHLTESNKQVLTSVFQHAMIYYSDLSNEGTNLSETVTNMSDILRRVINENVKEKVFLALILNKFNNFNELDEGSCKKFLDQLQHIVPCLDQLFVDILVEEKGLFSATPFKEYGVIVKLQSEQESMVMYKNYLQLINDAEHCLWMYCEDLIDCVRAGDAQKWAKIFANMKMKIFDNPFCGSDYMILRKYKDQLYNIQDYDKSDPLKKNKELNAIKSKLNKKEKKTVRLSQLCQRLIADKKVAGDATIARLLGLPPGVTVVKFDEQVMVFTDSNRRPCLFRVVLSNGESRKYLHKCGEPMRVDCAALSVQRACNSIWRVQRHVYNVTPLSEDCGLIEYLEGHERVRGLISGVCELKAPDSNKTADPERIFTPVQELVRIHDRNCALVPSYALRSAIEKHSASTQDFITKKKNYLNSLATLTTLNWILGVGDRHLQNIMCSTIDGSLVNIDWANVFKYGVGFEPAPARLTRNMLAVCDMTVLEGRIQQLMKTLRGSYEVLMPYLNVVFQWMGSEYHDKKIYIESTLKGTKLSYEIAKDVIRNIDEASYKEEEKIKKYKEKYVELYDVIFPSSADPTNVEERVYSVEEQISTFLKHCTDKRILGVTRKGWEPWI